MCESSPGFTPGLPYEVIKPLVVCLAVCMCVLYNTQGGGAYVLPTINPLKQRDTSGEEGSTVCV